MEPTFELDPEILALGIQLCLEREDGKAEAREQGRFGTGTWRLVPRWIPVEASSASRSASCLVGHALIDAHVAEAGRRLLALDRHAPGVQVAKVAGERSTTQFGSSSRWER